MDDSGPLADTFYGHWAGLYDRVATAPGVGSWRERTVADMNLSAGETVVEMGCGTGANFPYLRERVGPTGTVVGVDLVPAMLERARVRIDDEGWDNVRVLQGDVTCPPVDDVDAILATFVVGMLADPGRAVRAWIRRVRSGGRVTLLNATRSHRVLAIPLNLCCRAFVRATAPGYRTRSASPMRILERRWNEATGALFEGTTEHSRDRFGFGFVVLAGGAVPADSTGASETEESG